MDKALLNRDDQLRFMREAAERHAGYSAARMKDPEFRRLISTKPSPDDALQIVTLPAPIAGLSEVERSAIMEVIGVAEDMSLRGDDRAAVALAWMRDMLNEKALPAPDKEG